MTPNRISRTIELSESEIREVIPRSLSPPQPATSETPWRCFEFRVGADIIDPNSHQGSQSQPTTIPQADIFHSSLVASPKGEFYMFGGRPGPRELFRLELDTRNSVATIRSVKAAGIGPSPRHAHSAVWIGTSLMVIWGGHNTLPQAYSDTDIHVFNTSKSCRTWATS